MLILDPARVAQAILTAPGWARLGIIASSERLREQAAVELAQVIAHGLESAPEQDPRQQALPL